MKEKQKMEKAQGLLIQMQPEDLVAIRHQQRWAFFFEIMAALLFLGIGGSLSAAQKGCTLDAGLYCLYGGICVVIMGMLFRRERQVYAILKERLAPDGESGELTMGEEDERHDQYDQHDR